MAICGRRSSIICSPTIVPYWKSVGVRVTSFLKAAFATLALSGGVALAGEGPSYDNAILDALVRKGILSAQEAQAIVSEVKEKQAEQSSRLAGQEKEDIVKEVTASVASTIKKALPKVSIRLQPQFAYQPSDDGVEGTNNFKMRRARVRFTGVAPGLESLAYNVLFRADNNATTAGIVEAEVMYLGLTESVGEFHAGKTFPGIFFHGSNSLMLVQRGLADNMIMPGDTGRLTGAGWFKGTDLTRSSGFLNDTLHTSLGVFNGAVNGENVDNRLLYAGYLSVTPNGKLAGNEINIDFSPFKYQFGTSYALQNKAPGSEFATLGSIQAGQGAAIQSAQSFDNRFYSVFFEAEGNGWYGKARYAGVTSKQQDGPAALNSLGVMDDKFMSTAWEIAISKAFRLAKDRFWALAVAYESADVEHPLLAGITSQSQASNRKLVAFDEGDIWHVAGSYFLNKNIKLQLEYARSDGDKRGAELLGGTLDPQQMLIWQMTYNY